MKSQPVVSQTKKRSLVAFMLGEGILGLSLAFFLATFAFGADSVPQPGQKIFQAKCAQCHGKDAKGLPNMAKVLKVDPVNIDLTRADAVKLTDEEIVTTITNGKSKMPKFKGKLTAEQVQQIEKYLRSLQSAAVTTK